MDTSSTELLSAIKSYATGALKGNTVDTLGAPVDLINEALRPVGLASTKPIGGSKDLRERFGVGVEDKNVAETAGSLLSVGGVAKAMIIGAAKLGKTEKSADVYRDVSDNKLKTFISDSDSSLHTGGRNIFTGKINENQVVGSVLDHPELFKLYPGIETMKIKPLVGGVPGQGKVAVGENTIYVAPNSDASQLKATILHEIQHVVQNVEGFSKGGNPKMFEKADLEKSRAKIVKKITEPAAQSKALSKLSDAKTQAYKDYESLPGEQEARFTGATRNLSETRLKEVVLELLQKNSTPSSGWEKAMKESK